MSDNNAQNTAIWQITQTATRARRQDLLAAMVRDYGWVVQAGPFAGLRLSDRVCDADGNVLPKLLGCYEAELHDVVAEVGTTAPDIVVDVGAAEGYYAVGLARLFAGAFVHAFDTAQMAQDACRHTAGLNDLAARVSVSGQCSPDLLQAILPRGRVPLLICDAEGYERELIDPRRVPALRTTTILVECHDFVDASITRTLADRLSATHTLGLVREGGRDPNASPFLQTLDSLDRWLAVCEYRPTMMHWLFARPKP